MALSTSERQRLYRERHARRYGVLEATLRAIDAKLVTRTGPLATEVREMIREALDVRGTVASPEVQDDSLVAGTERD